jgi:hypothetical protein
MFLFADQSIWPAVWSAVAATCSAVTAGFVLWIHFRNREDSVRPEIIVDGWSFTTDENDWGIIRISKMQNEGKGHAFHVLGQVKVMGAKPIEQGGPMVALFHDAISILPAGKDLAINWEIKFQWRGCNPSGGNFPMAPVHLTIVIHDVHGRRYLVIYELLATKPKENHLIGGMPSLADDLYLTRRYAVIVPWWKLLWQRHKPTVDAKVVQLWERVTRTPKNSP